MKLIIPADREGGWKHIANACRATGVDYIAFDIYASDWIQKLKPLQFDGCIYRPEFRYAGWRELFAERIRFMAQELQIPIYPRLHELSLYESKRRMAYWLEAHQVPHPRTWVFGSKNEALEFINHARYPLIFKTDFGNASFGVRRVISRREALSIWRRSFGNGYRMPTYKEGQLDLIPRAKSVVRPAYRYLRGIRDIPRDVEIDVMLFQEEVDIAHEWRLIKSGDSFFGNEKLPSDRGFHSGSGHSAWTIPPLEVFDFARSVCLKGDFATMGLDIFQARDGRLLVNELQTIFGVVAKNQMYKEAGGKRIGCRKLFSEALGRWEEEEGEFGQDYCYRLRLKDFCAMLGQARV